VTDTEASQVF
jgi:lactoylglutathione lyase